MSSGELRPIYKHKHQSNLYAMGLMLIVVKVKIQNITRAGENMNEEIKYKDK